MTNWIMIVDDDTATLKMAGHIMSKAQMRVTALPSGQAMLDYIREHETPDLILLDIQMPEMDGYEATRAIRAMSEPAYASIPILAMTANAFKEDEEAAIEAGMQAHIAKPIDVNVMMKALASVLK